MWLILDLNGTGVGKILELIRVPRSELCKLDYKMFYYWGFNVTYLGDPRVAALDFLPILYFNMLYLDFGGIPTGGLDYLTGIT